MKLKTISAFLILFLLIIVAIIYEAPTIFSEPRKKLENFQKTTRCPSTKVLSPTSYEEAAEIVGDAYKNYKTVMVGSWGFASQIDAACADAEGIQITTKNLNRLIDIDRKTKSATVQVGMRFQQFAETISHYGLAVNMVTELSTFTIGGMLGSGTHGSTLQRPGAMLSDYVTKLKIVDGTGTIPNLEGELLDAARVNLGVLGLVLEVTIQLEDANKILGVQETHDSDTGLENKILEYPRTHYSTSISWFPGLKKYAVTIYREVPFTTTGKAFNAQADQPEWLYRSYKLITNLSHRSTKLSCLAANLRYATRKQPLFAENGQSIPKGAIGYAHRMQHFDCPTRSKGGKTCLWDITPIKLQEIGIPIDELPNVIKDIKTILKRKNTCFPLNGIYFRFAKASKSYLGMSAGRDTAFISTEYLLKNSGKEAPLNYDIHQEIEQMLLYKYKGRPHWGKNSIPIFIGSKNRFPKWDRFIAAKKELDPANTFTNAFWERASASIVSPEVMSKIYQDRCVEKDTCYCREDRHCGSRKKCMPGRFFKEASVCR